jgi:RNA polymerase sigma-70 factor (ECF subfamily)
MPASRPPLLDKESFSSLYSRTHLIIFRFIYGIHGGPIEEVEDITCETFLRAWKGRIRFSGDDQDALRWLFTIARHLVIDIHRKKKTHLDETIDRLDEIDFDSDLLPTKHTPEEITVNNEQYAKLWSLLQNLNIEKREMLVLRYLVGWQVKQIAEYLDMEENTVSVYIHRSLDQIRLDWVDL